MNGEGRGRDRRKSRLTMKSRQCDGIHRGCDTNGWSDESEARGGEIQVRKPGQSGRMGDVVRTYSPPLHLRNTECEPIIFSGFRRLGRYCSEKK